MPGEAASQFAGIILEDSSDRVRTILHDVYGNDSSSAYSRRKRPQVPIAIDAITRMKQYFATRKHLAAFLAAELPQDIVDLYREDIASVAGS